jgi:hypothetical protein
MLYTVLGSTGPRQQERRGTKKDFSTKVTIQDVQFFPTLSLHALMLLREAGGLGSNAKGTGVPLWSEQGTLGLYSLWRKESYTHD